MFVFNVWSSKYGRIKRDIHLKIHSCVQHNVFSKWSPCARNLLHSNIIIVIIIFISTFGIHVGIYSHRWESFMNGAHMCVCVRERAFKRLKIANKHLAKAKRLVNRSANKWNFVKKCLPLSIYLSCYICIAIIWLKMKAFIYWRLTKNRDDETIFGGFVWFFVCVCLFVFQLLPLS